MNPMFWPYLQRNYVIGSHGTGDLAHCEVPTAYRTVVRLAVDHNAGVPNALEPVVE